MMIKTLLATAMLLSHACAISIEKNSLRVNGASQPIDIDTATPRLSWRLSSHRRGDSQTAYQIQASSTKHFARPDLWDSKKVKSSDPAATYAGAELTSRSEVYWRTKVWDVDGSESKWSAPAKFEVSLLDDSHWSASWINNTDYKTGTTSLPVFAKDFKLDCKPSKARLYMAGLGLHIAEINGEPVTDDVLQPGYSTINDTVFYSTYDVTGNLDRGKNVLGVSLGKGAYGAEVPLLGRYAKFTQAYQQLRLIAQLEYSCAGGKTGKIVTDGTWKTSVEGPQIEASWYGGEEYDARRELADWSAVKGDRSSWSDATVTIGTLGKLVSPRAPPLKIVETVKPVSVEKNSNGFWVYDFGVNIAGTFSFTMKGTDLEGTRITFWPDERPGLGQSTTGGPTFDAYTLSGKKKETYSPKWLYHGMQYLGVNATWEPSLDDMTGYVIRASNEPVLSMSTSSDLFNGIHKIIDRSIQGNMYSVLTDCPHREKLGWLEQNHLVFEPVALGYDMQAYGYDMVRNMVDAQAEDVPGLIPDIAPEYGRPMGGGYRTDPNWGRAIVMVPYKMYQFYGDISILEAGRQQMIEYLGYLQNRAGGNPYLDDGGLGDWLALDTTTPKGAATTFGYHQAALYLSKVEAILGNTASAEKYAQLASDVGDGFHGRWFNETSGPVHYCPTNTQGCNAIALDMGVVPEQHKATVLSGLIASLEEHDWHVTVGEISLPSLLRVLKNAKRNDVVYKLMSSTTSPSYGYQIKHGATSLWEHWDADVTGGSLNHFMFGVGDHWLLQIAGLAQKSTSVAWKEIVYDPILEGDLTSASMSYVTPAGTAAAAWSLDGKRLTYSVTVPVGSTGWVYVTGRDIREGGSRPHAGKRGVISVKKGCERTLIKVGSGTYEFSSRMK